MAETKANEIQRPMETQLFDLSIMRLSYLASAGRVTVSFQPRDLEVRDLEVSGL